MVGWGIKLDTAILAGLATGFGGLMIAGTPVKSGWGINSRGRQGGAEGRGRRGSGIVIAGRRQHTFSAGQLRPKEKQNN